MRTLVHLSDLHFGAVDETVLAPLKRRIEQLQPHLLVVSGDLTQRARVRQFEEARRFLDTLPKPQLVVPGNHDVPLYNVYQRFFQPLDKYKRIITPIMMPLYKDEEIAVVGVNTARSLTIKDGRINEEQVAKIRAVLEQVPETLTKIVVSHHPFDLPPGWDSDEIVGRAPMAMQSFARCGADILMSGHLHVTTSIETTARYKLDGFSALVVQAGTATSTRKRGESNSFNVLRIDHRDVRVECHTWDEKTRDFGLTKTERFEHTRDDWAISRSAG
jgi:3',5'-cyclic AMP phosphodiesterase CpdA